MKNLIPPLRWVDTEIRNTLAANLTYVGKEASGEQSLEELVELVRHIRTGDLGNESWRATATSPNPSYGYFERDEQFSLSGVLDIAGCNLIKSVVLTFSGKNVDKLTLTGEGWVRTVDGDTVTYVRAFEEEMARADAQDAVDSIILQGDGASRIEATLVITAVGFNTDTVFATTGQTQFLISGTTFGVIEQTGQTWASIEEKTPTWQDIENSTKETWES